MAKSKKLSVMISSRCDTKFPLGSCAPLSQLRRQMKGYIESMELAGAPGFEVWINEETPPAGGNWNSSEVCLNAVKECDILIVLNNGEAGYATEPGGIGICHAELLEGLSHAPAKVRLIALPYVPTGKGEDDARNKRFQEYVRQQGLFRGSTAETPDQVLTRVKEALNGAVVSLVRAGVRDAARGKYHSGAALDWSRLNFDTRQAEMVRVMSDVLAQRKGSTKKDGLTFVSFDGVGVAIEVHAIPAPLSVGPALELVGRPFHQDYTLAGKISGDRGGPLHLIACHKSATESQATKLLGISDVTLVSAPFGIFVADPVQMVQFAFVANCRDEASTRHGVQRFLEWLQQSGEEVHVAERAQARARIIQAVAKEVEKNRSSLEERSANRTTAKGRGKNK